MSKSLLKIPSKSYKIHITYNGAHTPYYYVCIEARGHNTKTYRNKYMEMVEF